MGIAFGITQDNFVAQLEGCVFDASTDFGEERIRTIWKDQTDGVGFASPQRTGKGIGAVFQFAHRRQDAVASILGNEARVIDYMRYRCVRYSSSLGDFSNCGHRWSWDKMWGILSSGKRLRKRFYNFSTPFYARQSGFLPNLSLQQEFS